MSALATANINKAATLTVALVGNPNSGKTTLFNALTGLRQKVGNYPGVTVETKLGKVHLAQNADAQIIDLPGLYSLTPNSPDEVIARETLMGLRRETPPPDVILNVVDASNLDRNLYLTAQLLELEIPVVIALTMTDTASQMGMQVQKEKLETALGVPVVVVLAPRKQGLEELLEVLAQPDKLPTPTRLWSLPNNLLQEIAPLQEALQKEKGVSERLATVEAITLLMQTNEYAPKEVLSSAVLQLLRQTRERLAEHEIDFTSRVIESRYDWIAKTTVGVVEQLPQKRREPISTNQRLDSVAMHPFWGYVLFIGLMVFVFQSILLMGEAPIDWIDNTINRLGVGLTRIMPPGDLRDLLIEGVLGGVGTTLAFLPQILLLLFFIGLLEDSGYMARAAFLMDRLMSKVGLHGKSFIPMLSSFACAIPGIMATRTIGDRKARLITIMVAPLMSCSARLPVYLLMISAFVPNKPLIMIGSFTVLNLQGATFISMYFLGMVAAFVMAWLFHRTLLKGVAPSFLMELPPYRRPLFKSVIRQTLERAFLFIKRAMTLILAVSVVVWYLSSYPKSTSPTEELGIEKSYIGQMGRTIEPILTPIGFEWKIGIGILSSFVAREVFVSTIGTVYNVEDAEEEGNKELIQKMREDINPRTGKPVFTPLTAVSLMVFYVLAMQCMSTLAVTRRETNSWKWTIFQFVYMTCLAWVATFITYRVGLLLGFE